MFKLIIIGIGYMGKNYINILKRLNNVSIEGLIDININSISHISPELNINTYTTIENFIKENPKPHAAIISTPASTHAEISIQLSKLGINHLIEKPVEVHTENLKAIIEISTIYKTKIAVAQIERYNPVLSFIRDIIKNEGENVFIKIERKSSYPERVKDVGVLHDLGVHDLDLLLYITKLRPTIWDVDIIKEGNKEIFSSLSLSWGRINTILISHWMSTQFRARWEIIGRDFKVFVDFKKKEIKIYRRKLEKFEFDYIQNLNSYDLLEEQVKEFLLFLEGKHTKLCTLEEAYNTLEVIDQVLIFQN